MKNYTKLYEDVFFYSKEYERAKAELEALKARGEGANALLRAERELEKIKKKLDALCTELPEEISEKGQAKTKFSKK